MNATYRKRNLRFQSMIAKSLIPTGRLSGVTVQFIELQFAFWEIEKKNKNKIMSLSGILLQLFPFLVPKYIYLFTHAKSGDAPNVGRPRCWRVWSNKYNRFRIA